MALKCFVINLKKDVERREFISQELHNLGIDFEIFEASYGKDLSSDFLAQCRQNDELIFNLKGGVKVKLESKLTVNEIGCAHSHLRVYQHIIDSGLDKALIVEDDIHFKPDLEVALKNLDKITEPWDIVSFSIHTGIKNLWGAKKYHFGDGLYFQRVGMRNDFLDAHINARRIVGGATCYVVTKEACQKLINLGYPIRMPSDFLLGMLAYNHLKTIRAYPIGAFLSITDIKSTIGGGRSNELYRL